MHVGAFGHVAHVAQITLVYHLPVILLVDTVDFHGLTFVDQVEQGREGIAQAYTATAAMADIEDALHFFEGGVLVIKFWIKPIERVPCRGF